MAKLKFTISAATISKDTRCNQDNLVVDKFLINVRNSEYVSYNQIVDTRFPMVFCVSDGVGGQDGGDIASEKVVLSIYDKIDEIKAFNKQKLNECLDAVNAEVIERLEEEGCNGGATLSLLVIGEEKACFCNIGDSPIFLYRKKSLVELSEEHTLANEKGKFISSKNKNYESNVLTKYIGNTEESGSEQAKIDQKDVRNGDIYVICSDGITKGLTVRKIKNILKNYDVTMAAHKLVECAKSHGANDDITAIEVKVED